MIIGQFLKGELFSSETVSHSAINRGNRSGNRIGRNFREPDIFGSVRVFTSTIKPFTSIA